MIRYMTRWVRFCGSLWVLYPVSINFIFICRTNLSTEALSVYSYCNGLDTSRWSECDLMALGAFALRMWARKLRNKALRLDD